MDETEYGEVKGIGQEKFFSHFRPIIDIVPEWYERILLLFIKTRKYSDEEGWVKYKKLFGKTFVVDVSTSERYDSPYVIDPKSFNLDN